MALRILLAKRVFFYLLYILRLYIFSFLFMVGSVVLFSVNPSPMILNVLSVSSCVF